MRINARNINVRLSRQQIEDAAPAVYSDRPASHVSPKYSFVNTGNVVEMLENNGWHAYNVRQQKSRIPGLEDATKHCVSLANASFGELVPQLGSLFPTVTLVNSHNWASRFEVVFGMFRQVCGNGLTVMAGEFAGISVRHDHITSDIMAIIGRMESYSRLMIAKFQNWNEIQVSDEDRQAFLLAAAEVRFGVSEDPNVNLARAVSLGTVRRSADDTNSLWTLYNRAQENSIEGGIKGIGMKRKPREITNIGKRLEINSKLFELADGFSRNHVSMN